MLSYIHGLNILDFSYCMSLKVFSDLQADMIFCFSKTLRSLTIIGQINLLLCLDIGGGGWYYPTPSEG